MLFSQAGVILITPTCSSLGLISLNKGQLLHIFCLTNRYLCNRKAWVRYFTRLDRHM